MKLVFIFLALCALADGAEVKIGEKFPGLSLQNFKTKKQENLDSLFKKNTLTLVDFWASWCKPCEKSLPFLNGLFEKNRSRGFAVIGISADDTIEEGIKFLKDHEIGFSAFFDKDRQLIERAGVPAMPSSYLVNTAGEVIFVHHGFRDGDAEIFTREINKYLK